MKKKAYMMPQTLVADIDTEMFCAASIEDSLSDVEVAGNDMLSKENNGFDLWADDEEN